jgi:SAM-dependent methyltransferase
MTTNRLRTHWQEIPTGEGIDEPARVYAKSMHNNPYDHYLERVAALGLRGERMLDAGCGTGTWSFPFAEFFDRVDGIDLSEGRIALARAMAAQLDSKHVHFSVGDVLNLPYEDHTFDLVFCYSVVISYIPIRVLLTEFARVLKPGGQLFVVLNGLGFSYHLRDVRAKADPKYLPLGVRGIYNTLIQSNRAVTPQAVRDRADRLKAHPGLARVRKAQQLPMPPESFLAGLGWAELDDLARRIGAECGPDYVRTLADDVIRIMTGSHETFAHAKAGRGYAPGEVAADLKATGFDAFRWAQEERLFARLGQRFSRGHLVNGHLSTWEFIATRV